MIRPSLTTVLLFLAGTPLALGLVIYNPRLWPFLLDYAGLILLLALIDAFASAHLRHFTLTATAPPRVFIGETASLDLGLAFKSRRPRMVEILPEHAGPLPPTETALYPVEAASSTQVNIALKPERRGQINIPAIWVRWRGPLRLTERFARLPIEKVIDVVPNIRSLHKEGLKFLAEDAIFGRKSVAGKGEGTEFEALREYMPGMDYRFVDWKRSAKNRELLCKEFRTERNHPIVMAFDTGHLMQEPIAGLTRLDHVINAGLRLAWVSLQCGDLAGVWAFDEGVRQFTPPTAGAAAFGRIQTALAALEYHPFETNFTLGLAELNARLKRRALVVLFTDFVDSVSIELLVDSLGAIANRHAVLFVTLRDQDFEAAADAAPETVQSLAEAVVAHDFLSERRVVFERLKRLGISCLDTTVSGLSVDLVNRYLAIKRNGDLG